MFGAFLTVAIHVGWLDKAFGQEPGYMMDEWLNNNYAISLLGVVFGYLCVTRINMSYSRYWEGVTQVKTMHSKWADACAQCIIFDRSRDPALDLRHEPFSRHLIRLFSQLSA